MSWRNVLVVENELRVVVVLIIWCDFSLISDLLDYGRSCESLSIEWENLL